jgi:hypothetical protein
VEFHSPYTSLEMEENETGELSMFHFRILR